MLKSLTIIAAIFIITAAFGFRTALRVEPAITIVFYNVENLFDTIDTPDVIDEDFTPTGKLNWNASRYQKKLKDLVKVLSSASGSSYPAAIGLCEIENRAVVEDLMKTAEFNKMNYRVVHEESADDRGIDVAFAYNPKVMSELYHEKMRVRFDFDSKAKTRDILYIKTLAGKDTLHFFVNHWPSRREGQEESEKRRLVPAQMLRAKTDSLRKVNPKAKIIIMGDFNDYPDNKTMIEVLNCAPGSGSGLTNLTYHLHKAGTGSYNYKGEWGMLDQFIVSDGILNSPKGWSATDTSAAVFGADWLLYTDKKSGEKSPSKTFGGSNYFGGYSDHLPIILHLHNRKSK